MIAIVVAALALVYIGLSWRDFSSNTGGYGDLWLGATPEEVSYYEGKPTAELADGAGGGQEWIHDTNGRHLETHFAAGRAVELACGTVGSASECPSALGFSVGDTEDSLYKRLGPPTSEGIVNGVKAMHYNDIGFTFLLERGQIRRIVLQQTSQRLGAMIGRYVRWAIP